MTDVQVPETEAWREVLRDLEVLRRDLRVLEVGGSSDLASRLREDLLSMRRRVRSRVAADEKGTVSLSWRQGDFEALLSESPGTTPTMVTVSGYRAGPFGVHRHWSRFDLVHIPSGLPFTSYRLLREAKRAAALLSDLPVDWNEPDEDKLVQPPDLQKKIRHILKACKEKELS